MNRVYSTTKKNIVRNRWFSLSTSLVITIVFTITSILTVTTLLLQKAVKYSEKRAQVIIFFKQETPENEIFAFRDAINNPALIQDIEYTSKEQALEIYKQDFKDDPDLVETVTTNTLPPSLGVRATSIDNLEKVITLINTEKDKNAYVDEVMYFKDVVDGLKTVSKAINYGAVIIIGIMLVIAVAIISVTISFNVISHKNEIEIMHLVGGTDRYIKLPYILEGTFYGVVGGLVSSLIILTPWYIFLAIISKSDLSFLVTGVVNDLGVSYLNGFNIVFVLVFILSHLVFGSLLGGLSSYFAILKHINLSDK